VLIVRYFIYYSFCNSVVFLL